MHTKDKLAAALEEAGCHAAAELAAKGHYDDYLSDLDSPTMQLVEDLSKVGTPEALAIRARVIDGEFDGTAEESLAWANSLKGQEAFSTMLGGTSERHALDDEWDEFRAAALPANLTALEVGVAKRVFYGGALVMFNLFGRESARHQGIRSEFVTALLQKFAAVTVEWSGEGHQGGMQ